jgi:hypothetical protein
VHGRNTMNFQEKIDERVSGCRWKKMELFEFVEIVEADFSGTMRKPKNATQAYCFA